MTDRVFPSKPAANGFSSAAKTTNGAAVNQSFPATKAQVYNANRPAYRPTPYHDRRRRSFCCSCFLWTTLFIIILLFLAAATGGVLYLLYRPQRPSFSLTSLKISQFNLTSSSHLTSKFNLTVTSRNPNKKITFYYNPITVLITSNGVNLGSGSFPAYTHGTKNTTILKATVTNAGDSVDGAPLKNKKSLPLRIQLETKVKVKMGGMKTEKVGIRVKCSGIKATLPTGKSLIMPNPYAWSTCHSLEERFLNNGGEPAKQCLGGVIPLKHLRRKNQYGILIKRYIHGWT